MRPPRCIRKNSEARRATRPHNGRRFQRPEFRPQEIRMQYFVTGATGFIGKRLVKALLARRGATVHFLLRAGSEGKVPELLKYWGVTKARAIPVIGDLTAKKLGVSGEDVKALKGQVDHFYHLAAVYDLG